MYTAPNGRSCLLISIEGADRTGKATQAAMLQEALNRKGHQSTVEEVPYQDHLTHAMIYRMLRDGGVRKYPKAFQTLHCLNRHNFQTNYLPALARHFEVVVLDRWNLSTLVYGEIDGVSREETEYLLTGISEPDLVFVLDGSAFPKDNLDVLEADTSFQQQVRAKYLEWCEKRPEYFVKIDASRPKSTVHGEILSTVMARFFK